MAEITFTFEYDVAFREDGVLIRVPVVPPGAIAPVQCTRCGAGFDMANVTVTARYADCSMFRTPCCDREADDRAWKISPDIKEIRRANHP